MSNLGANGEGGNYQAAMLLWEMTEHTMNIQVATGELAKNKTVEN